MGVNFASHRGRGCKQIVCGGKLGVNKQKTLVAHMTRETSENARGENASYLKRKEVKAYNMTMSRPKTHYTVISLFNVVNI